MKISRFFFVILIYPLVNFVLYAQTADFYADKTEVCVDETVTFTDNSSGFGGTETYDWDFGTDASPATATGEGPYSVIYNSAGSKTVTLVVTESSTPYTETKTDYITVYSNPTASITPDPAETCEGVGLSLNGNPSGGSGTYTTHLWTGAGETYLDDPNSQTPTFTCGTAGSYSLTYTVTDDNGCLGSDGITVTVYSNPSASITPDPAGTCEGVGLSLNGNPSGGSGTYTTHFWSGPGATYLNNVNSQTPVFTCGTAGSYSLTYTVTDNNGCEGSDNITVTVYPNPTANITPDPAEVCSGSDLFLNGNPAGGSGSYTTHTWTGDTGPLSATNIINPTFNASVVVTTTYNLTYAVVDNRGCTGSDNIIVTNFAYPLDNLTVSNPVICLNETASIIVSNSETTVSYQLRLDLGDILVGTPKNGTGGDLTFNVTPSSTTDYNVYATTTSSTCSIELLQTSTVTVNPLPNQYEVIGGGSYCAGGDGKPVYLADSETGFSYQLQRNVTDIGSSVDGTDLSIGFGDQTAAGTYTVVATNQTTFCQNDMSGSVDVIINPLPTAYNVTGGGSYCAGGSGVPVGLSNSQTGISYQLKVDNTDIGSPVGGSDGSPISFGNQTTEGTYTVFANNTTTGCTSTMTGLVDVIIKPLPEATISGGGTICQGETTDVIVSLTGTPDFTFIYAINSVNQPLVNTSNNSDTINTGTAGTYTLVSVDDAICSGGIISGSAVVTVNSLPVPQNVSGGGSYCSGSSGIEVSLSGSENNVDYQLLLDGMNTGSPVPGDGSPVSFGDQTAEGNYTVTATNSLTGCFNTMTGLVNVIIDPLPVAYSVTGGGSYCNGGIGVEVGLSGSEIGIDYQLQKDGSDISTPVSGTGSAISFGNQTEAGNYTVVATNTTTGCVNSMTGSVDVVINPLPTPVISGDQQVCENDQGLSYSAPYINGHNYYWLVTGGSIVFGQNTHFIIVDWGSAGTGTVKVTETVDVTGCDSTSSDYSVTIYPLPSTPTITGELSYCAGSTTTLISSAGDGYLWSTGEATQSINVSEGDYSVLITDANGCQSSVSSTVTVSEIPLPTATISGDAAICDDGSEATITVNLTGTAPWEITYQIDGANESTITNINSSPYKFNTLIPGQYSISQVSDTFCTGNSFGSVTLTVNLLPDVDIIGLNSNYNFLKDSIALFGNPTGGNFFGPGVYDFEKLFSPKDAGLGVHEIIYKYTDNKFCTNYDTVEVTIIDAEGEINSLSGNTNFIYCYNSAIDTLRGSSVGGEIGGRFSGDGVDSVDIDLAIFNPVLAGPGSHQIFYTYIKDLVPLDIIETFIVDSIGDIDFIGLDQEYCINNDAVILTPILPTDGGGSGTIAFSGSTGISGDIFNPGNAVVGANTVTLTYTRDYSGCINILNRAVQVYDIPHLDFAISDGCVNERDSTIFFNLTSSIDPVITWKWDFDDPASLDENTSDQKTPKHQYPGFGRRSVQLIVITDNNCSDTLVKDIDFEEKPLAGFEWENECYSENKSIPFKDKTFSNSPITNYFWKFYDTNGTDTLATYNTKDTDFIFPTQSDYTIELIVNTANGCTDTINQTIQLRPTIKLVDGVYFEDFESGPQGWIAEAAGFSINSWEFGFPSNNIINSAASGNTAWVTNLNGNHFDGEDSWVTGPCFDFREMNRPMIKMNILANSEGDRDGAILQYSTNNGINWNRVGEYGDDKGLNWFNSVGILGNPGGQQQGWSGTDNNDWQEVRHDLDPLLGLDGVQFRVAFGAGAEGNMEGFAFDNIWIGERTRKVLLEHFTNTNESQSEKADNTVNAIANIDTLDVIDIQYHTNFPGSDVLNEYYPAGPGARAIYYGISDVPYSVMDGWEYFEGFNDQDDYLWKESSLIKRSLNDPQLHINLDANILNGNTLSIDVKVDTLKSVPSNHEVTLHIVVLENQVEADDKTYENVIRKMLPDPGGTPITTGLLQGSVSISESWSFNATEIDPAEFIVVAFVQDEETGEIFQAASVNSAVITGITNPVSGISELSFSVYPNPSSGKAYILFSKPLQDDYFLNIFNNLGALIENKVLRNGVQFDILDTENYQNGMYIIRIMKGNKTFGIKRLSIVH